MKSNFTFQDFSKLDDSATLDYFVNSMLFSCTIESIRNIKRIAINMLTLHEKDHVIDIGCGTGYDSFEMSRILKYGTVVGVDNSSKMIEICNKYNKTDNAIFTRADINALPFPESIYTCSYADRVLLSQEDPIKTLKEMIRVTKNGGKICITDIDLDTILLNCNHSKINTVIAEWKSLIKNPHIGRNLLSYFYDLNIKEIKFVPSIFMSRSLEEFNKINNLFGIIENCVNNKILSKHDAANIINEVQVLDKNNLFMYTINFYTICGTITK